MSKFIIAPHMRLHEWVAEEKGYFEAEGLEYEFQDQLRSKDGKIHDLGDKVGAFQTYERGRTCDVSSACHWTVNVAASAGHGLLYRDAYSVLKTWPTYPSRLATSRAAITPPFKRLSLI
jgi:hypothetical protein